MPAYIETFNYILALGTVLLQFTIVYIVFNLIFLRKKENYTLSFFKKNTILFSFLIALSGLVLSLFYSDVIGYPPCELCVIQRFFIYPQALFFGLALYIKKNYLIIIGTFLAFIEIFIAIYHVYVENGGESNLPCASDAINAVTCNARYVHEFGYVTIPVMALTTALFVVVLYLNNKFYNEEKLS